MKQLIVYIILTIPFLSYGQYPVAAGQPGTTAIHKDSSIIVNWAFKVVDFDRGLQNSSNSASNEANFGDSTNALGAAEGNSSDIVSLGDNGSIVLSFEHPIKNAIGPDFAVYENSFDDSFLELAHVEVSTDGIIFIRLPSISLTNTSSQTGSFASTDPTKIHNLAGKYRQGYGTPFDLEDIIDSTGINLDSINFVKIIDVAGSINPLFATYDSQGNIINDPYPTEFGSGGFDLDAVAVVNENKFVGLTNQYANTFKIYPNPAQSSFQINNSTPGLLEMYNINGRVVYSRTIEAQEIINITEIERGIYIITFSSSKGIFTKKTIVN